jgi:hypothetical protein
MMDIATLTWISTLAILIMLTLDLILTYAGLRIMLRVEQEASKTLAASQASLDAIARVLATLAAKGS